jgi:hypothetical protein
MTTGISIAHSRQVLAKEKCKSDMMVSSLPDELYFASKQGNLLPLPKFTSFSFWVCILITKKRLWDLGMKWFFFGVYKTSSQAPSLSMD